MSDVGYRPHNLHLGNRVHIDDPQASIFGEMLVVQPTPVVQLDPLNGTRDGFDTEVFTATGGSVTTENTGTGYEFKCSTGTSVGGYGLIRARRALRYRPGQGSMFRWTARYDNPVTNGLARSGPVNSGAELSFGYNGGTDFGIFYRTGGVLESRKLTISTPAAGNETLTITLNGTAFPVSITSGTAAHNAHEIAQESFTGWTVYQNDGAVIFTSTTTGAKAGSYSASSDGSAVAAFSTVTTGVASTDTFIEQYNWNEDKMDGNGISRQKLNPQKGNVFQVTLQYLGYGSINFYVENSETGDMQLVHRITYANSNTSVSLVTPNLKLGWFAASAGSTTDFSIYGGSGSAMTQGKQTRLRNPTGFSNSKTSIGTSFTNVLSIRCRRDLNGSLNLDDIIPLDLSVAVDGTKPAECRVYLNGTVAGEPNWTYEDEDNSIAEYDTAGTTVTEGANTRIIQAISLAKAGGAVVDLSNLGAYIVPGDIITIAVKATSGTTDASASLIWSED